MMLAPCFGRRGRRPLRTRAARGGFMIRVLLALLGLSLTAGAGRATDGQLTAADVKQSLFSTCFVDAQTGWMVGELGRIYHTTDGGKSWVRQDAATKRALLTISCRDAKTAWIAGKEGLVYHTTNGGDSWVPQKSGSARHVFSIEFPSATRGHGVGDFGTMIHTEDG